MKVEIWQHERSGDRYAVVVNAEGFAAWGNGPLTVAQVAECLTADPQAIFDDGDFNTDGLMPWSEQQYDNFRAEHAA